MFLKICSLLETFVQGPLNLEVLELYDPNILYVHYTVYFIVQYIVTPCISRVVLYTDTSDIITCCYIGCY